MLDPTNQCCLLGRAWTRIIGTILERAVLRCQGVTHSVLLVFHFEQCLFIFFLGGLEGESRRQPQSGVQAHAHSHTPISNLDQAISGNTLSSWPAVYPGNTSLHYKYQYCRRNAVMGCHSRAINGVAGLLLTWIIWLLHGLTIFKRKCRKTKSPLPRPASNSGPKQAKGIRPWRCQSLSNCRVRTP
jgi:hypothetical protein